MGEFPETPTPELQKEILKRHLSRSIYEGETWYLISVSWLQRLKEYVGMDSSQKYARVAHPGPIDNSKIIDGKSVLLKNLIDKYDYDLLRKDTWDLLVKWYGIIDGQKPIARKAIKHSFVEVYKFEINCVNDNADTPVRTFTVSRNEKLSKFHKTVRDFFDVHDAESRLWSGNGNDGTLLDLNKLISEENSIYFDSGFVYLDIRLPDGSWTKEKRQQTIKQATPGSCYRSIDDKVSAQVRTRQYTSKSKDVIPGLCGLVNIGNTCFMNSVIQCMSNCPPITNYFLEKRHEDELNKSNPLGMRGEIALAYGELITQMWSGHRSECTPTKFKTIVGQFNPTFSGIMQHDSQELLTFLLDGLHEDLNRVKDKPYIEINDDQEKDDNIAAEEAWENYRKRNNSIIVDTFHGLLKSTVICPDCEKRSVTFDPFCSLSLPLPVRKERCIKVTFMPYSGRRKEVKYAVSIAKNAMMSELIQEIATKTLINPDNILLAEIYQSHFHKFFGIEDSISIIDELEKIDLKACELPICAYTPNFQHVMIPVTFWEMCKEEEPYKQNHLFGIPFLVVLPRKTITFDELKLSLIEKMKRHFELDHLFAPTDSNMEEEFNKGEVTMNRWFTVYYNNSFENSILTALDPDKPINVNDFVTSEHHLSKYSFIIQFSPAQRREYFSEKPAILHEFIPTLNSSREIGKIGIQDCLRLFTTVEKLSAGDAWYCNRCKKHQRATKKFDLWRLPDILIVHLKRFSNIRMRRDKINALVEFPINGLNMEQYLINSRRKKISYDLIGVCNHYGSMGAGHYTAFCKNPKIGSWFKFDDYSVSPISDKDVMTQYGYVLFYSMTKEESDNRMDIN